MKYRIRHLMLWLVVTLSGIHANAQEKFKIKIPDGTNALDVAVLDSNYRVAFISEYKYQSIVFQYISENGILEQTFEVNADSIPDTNLFYVRNGKGALLDYGDSIILPFYNEGITVLATVTDAGIVHAQQLYLNDTTVISVIYEMQLLPDSTVLIAGVDENALVFVAHLSKDWKEFKTWHFKANNVFTGILYEDENIDLFLQDKNIYVVCQTAWAIEYTSIYHIDLETGNAKEIAGGEEYKVVLPAQDLNGYFLWHAPSYDHPYLYFDKFDSTGNKEWGTKIQYGHLYKVPPMYACNLKDSSIILVFTGFQANYFYAMKWGVDGILIWTRWYETVDDFYGYEECSLSTFFNDLKPTRDGGFVLAGSYNIGCNWSRGGYYKNNALVLKADADGCIEDYPCSFGIQVAEKPLQDFTIGPNPAFNRQFFIETDQPANIQMVLIYDQTGKLVETRNSPENLLFETDQHGLLLVEVVFTDGYRARKKIVVP